MDGLLPRAAAVVHHGGVGTVGAALHAGTPQIIRPFFGDQPFWAGRLRELGVAPRPLKRVTGEALAERLRVIDDLAAVGTTALVMALHVYDAAFSASLRRRLMDKLARLPLGWFASRGSGEVKKIVGDDVNSLHYVVTHAETDCVGAVATPLIVLIYLFSVQWRLALVLLLPVLAYVIVMVRIMRRDADNVARSQRYTSRISAQTQTFISSRQEARSGFSYFGVWGPPSSPRARRRGYLEPPLSWTSPAPCPRRAISSPTGRCAPVPSRSSPSCSTVPPRFSGCCW